MGNGDPSAFLERKPAAKRLEAVRGLISNDVVGGAGMGEEPASLVTGSGTYAENVGGGISNDESVGVDSTCSGVLKSARVPFSLSSRQRTPRLVFDGDVGLFFAGENCTPFLTATIFLRRGEAFMGEEVR